MLTRIIDLRDLNYGIGGIFSFLVLRLSDTVSFARSIMSPKQPAWCFLLLSAMLSGAIVAYGVWRLLVY